MKVHFTNPVEMFSSEYQYYDGKCSNPTSLLLHESSSKPKEKQVLSGTDKFHLGCRIGWQGWQIAWRFCLFKDLWRLKFTVNKHILLRRLLSLPLKLRARMSHLFHHRAIQELRAMNLFPIFLATNWICELFVFKNGSLLPFWLHQLCMGVTVR